MKNNKKQKLMTSMKFRENLTGAIKEAANGTEIIVMHYSDPVAKFVKLTDEEAQQIKIDMQNKAD